MKREFIGKIAKVQKELKAPKSKYNSFGGYYYRSTEDILEAAKPLLAAEGLVLTVSDELINVGDRYYVKATARITDGEDVFEVSASAREQVTKKGMDESQITGSASTYARKYALNGLFCIDDTKDADTEEQANESKKRSEKEAVFCVECGQKLKAKIQTKSGELTAAEFAAKYKGMCPECYTRYYAAQKNAGGSK